MAVVKSSLHEEIDNGGAHESSAGLDKRAAFGRKLFRGRVPCQMIRETAARYAAGCSLAQRVMPKGEQKIGTEG